MLRFSVRGVSSTGNLDAQEQRPRSRRHGMRLRYEVRPTSRWWEVGASADVQEGGADEDLDTGEVLAPYEELVFVGERRRQSGEEAGTGVMQERAARDSASGMEESRQPADSEAEPLEDHTAPSKAVLGADAAGWAPGGAVHRRQRTRTLHRKAPSALAVVRCLLPAEPAAEPVVRASKRRRGASVQEEDAPPRKKVKQAARPAPVGVCDLTSDEEEGGRGTQAAESTAKSWSIRFPNREDGVELHESELLALAPLAELNGSVINLYIRYLLHSGAVRPHFHVASTYFYAKLCQVAASTSEAGAARDLRSLLSYLGCADLFHQNAVAIPIHGAGHWSLAVVCSPRLLQPLQPGKKKAAQGPAPFLLHLDSLAKGRGGHDTSAIARRLGRFVKDAWRERERALLQQAGREAPKAWHLPDLRDRRVQVPQQDNSSDCGLFLLLNLRRFLSSAPNVIPFSQVDEAFRGHDYCLAEAGLLRGQLLQLAWGLFREQHGVEWSPSVSAATGALLRPQEDTQGPAEIEPDND